MKSFDTGYAMREDVNPRFEGDYKIYGGSQPAPTGGFHPVVHIERVAGIENAPQVALDRHVMNADPLKTKDLAEMWAVSYGVRLVNDGSSLLQC